MTNSFLDDFLKELLCDLYRFNASRPDVMRFSDCEPRRHVKDGLLKIINSCGFARRRFYLDRAITPLGHVIRNYQELEKAYVVLADSYSRKCMLNLLSRRILGEWHVKLLADNEAFWRLYDSVERRYMRERRTVVTRRFDLSRFVIPGAESDLNVHLHPCNILNIFLLEQYAYSHDGCIVRVKDSDVVIDGGGCWGDTALYFADRVGAGGIVYSFEFAPDNLEVFHRNCDLNPELKGRIRLIASALGDNGLGVFGFASSGPGQRLVDSHAEDGGALVTTVSIDDVFISEKMSRVDFIKLDIEGFELRALRGAEQTLRRFRPVLAVSLYHKPEDIFAIPNYLAGLDLGYKFYLDHFTTHNEETVLFAKPA